MKSTNSSASLIVKLALWQIGISTLLSTALYFWMGQYSALSALFGGLTCAIANLFFAGRLFFARQGVNAESMVARFYLSESMKIVFTLAIMAVCIIVVKVAILPFIIAYLVAAVLVNWLFLLKE